MHSPSETALGLLRRARDDGYVADRPAQDPAAPDWVIGFHAQQAARASALGMHFP